MERAGKTIRDITAWLAAQGVQVGKSSVHRALEQIRAEAPLPPESPKPAVVLEPINEDDELRLMRRMAHDEMVHGDEWKQRQGGLRCLIAVRAEIRASRAAAQQPAEQPTDAPSAPTTVVAPIFGLKPSASA